jgi:hypothetical protein
MAYDSVRGRTVLFGGSGIGGFFGDTWEWDGANWVQVATTGPSARAAHATAYESQRGRTVMFGGHDSTGMLGDTWEWDGAAWLPQIFASGPAPRFTHAMAYDSQRGRTVLFGGNNPGVLYGDSWEWDGIAWTQMSNTGPVARWLHAMAYDSQRGRTVMFGGGNYSGLLSDTWEWDGTAWTQVATTGPSPRWTHAMAHDSQRGRTVLFGGDGNNGNPGDTWEWDGSVRASTATIFGAGCGSPALDLAPVAMARPVINTTASASVNNIPSSLAFVALGWSNTTFGAFALPLTLTGFGLPGCDLLTSSEFSALPVTSTGPGTATFSLPLPNINGLVGLHVYLQGWAYAPGVNAGDLIVSNSVDWGIGNS